MIISNMMEYKVLAIKNIRVCMIDPPLFFFLFFCRKSSVKYDQLNIFIPSLEVLFLNIGLISSFKQLPQASATGSYPFLNFLNTFATLSLGMDTISFMIFAIRETAVMWGGGLCPHPARKRWKRRSPGVSVQSWLLGDQTSLSESSRRFTWHRSGLPYCYAQSHNHAKNPAATPSIKGLTTYFWIFSCSSVVISHKSRGKEVGGMRLALLLTTPSTSTRH